VTATAADMQECSGHSDLPMSAPSGAHKDAARRMSLYNYGPESTSLKSWARSIVHTTN
jgi:hypothetical protein